MTVAIIILVSTLILRISSRLIDRVFKLREAEQLKLLRDTRRLLTLRTLMKSIIKYAVYFAGAIMILAELGVNTSSLIAGAGIAGVALGFGAQNLVRDMITGFFILFDDQFAVGDYVGIAGVSGTVEEIGLRVTRVRDFAGQLHIVPNGSIGLVTNFRGRSMRVMFDVQVDYSTDIGRAMALLNRAFKESRSSIAGLVEGPTVLGVQSLGESGVALRVWATAKPMSQWDVERDINLLIKSTLDENGIRVAFPQRRVIFDNVPGEKPPGSDVN
ncbi:MAG: mechanosensitive ion channel family protein [Clostridia bacterium]|nr:mechanosensitive ion channel family protein [Clostridia bacterium]